MKYKEIKGLDQNSLPQINGKGNSGVFVKIGENNAEEKNIEFEK